jgi:23S rRNA (pseudouridine1915-N3)-methyltransferase
MRLTIAAVGQLRGGPLAEAFADYAGRLKSGRWTLDMVEVEERRRLSGPELVAREGELLLAAIPRGAVLVAMDPRGVALSSEDLAARLGRLRDEGASVAFAIGGADGLAPEVLRAARLTLSLGAMTWPHMLARVMLAEQLFRAQSILSGHPYHRG